jgi:hypothetical protein
VQVIGGTDVPQGMKSHQPKVCRDGRIPEACPTNRSQIHGMNVSRALFEVQRSLTRRQTHSGIVIDGARSICNHKIAVRDKKSADTQSQEWMKRSIGCGDFGRLHVGT